MNASDNTGLGLFDDTASAVGNFPTALRGYDRTAVDDYVRTLEESVVKSRRHSAQLEQQVTVLQDEVASSGEKTDKDLDYANLGGRANDILRLAQEQARELVQNATIEAEKSRSKRAARQMDCETTPRARVTPSRAAVRPRSTNCAPNCARRFRLRSTRPRLKVTP